MRFVQENDLSVLIDQALVESPLLTDHGNVSCWDQASDGCEKACLPAVRLSYEAYDLFLVLFNAAVEESNVIFAKVRHFQLVEVIL